MCIHTKTLCIIRWLTTLAYAGFIFYLSSRAWQGDPLFPFADKVIHCTMYFMLGGLCVWSLRVTSLRGRGAVLPLAAAMAAIYGITDEIHQLFVPGRTADVLDWIADAAGAIVGAWIATILARWLRNNEKVRAEE